MSIYDDIEAIKEKLEKEQEHSLRIALFGQPGSGKSSLINKLIGKNVAKTGASTDVTTTAGVYPYNQMVLVDLPGYGTSKFPPNQWFQEFKPEDFDLFLCVFSGKFHEADTKFFRELKENNRVCLFVRNMHDQLWDPEKEMEALEAEVQADVQQQVGEPVNVYFTSCRTGHGFDRLQEGIQHSLGPAQQDKYTRSAKSYTLEHLIEKKEACKKMVYRYAGIAAANGLNPIPGVDLTVDVSIMLKLFAELRESYGIEEKNIKNMAPALVPIANRVIEYATKEGIMIILKKYATRLAVKSTAKYVPFVGQAIAASASFGMTLAAGLAYLDDVHMLAEEILNKELMKEAARV